MASNILRRVLSGSTNGAGIVVAANTAPGTLIHTATSASDEQDEVYLWGASDSTSNVNLSLVIGTTAIPLTVQFGPKGEGLVQIDPGMPLTGGATIRAYSIDGAGAIVLYGIVNRIKD